MEAAMFSIFAEDPELGRVMRFLISLGQEKY